MSKESFIRFTKEVEADAGLRAKVTKLQLATRNGENRAADLLALASERGFDFSEQDVRACNDALTADEDELSDEALEAVVGGGGYITMVGVGIVMVGGSLLSPGARTNGGTR